MLWALGFLLYFCGLFIWLEYGTMFPRSGGEKVYLEAVYKKPKYLATIIFATNAILLGFTSANCIVCVPIPWFDIYLFLFIHPCYRCSRTSEVFLIIVFQVKVHGLQHSNCSRPRPR